MHFLPDDPTRIIFLDEGKARNEFGITHLVAQTDIPQDFIDECRALAAETANKPFRELGLQVRLHPAVRDHMLNIGHNPGREPLEKTKALLRAWGLDYMIIDNRRV